MAPEPASNKVNRRGLMLVLSSPSGAGKSTIARNLLESDKSFELSVSVTTRPRRPSEIDGVHYHFVTKQQFEHMRDHDELAEWALVHDNYYGTPRKAVESALNEGRDMLFDIDWQGAQQLRDRMRADVVEIFVLPPSISELRSRLRRRAEDTEEVIERRLTNAREEIKHWIDYDYIIINDDLNRAFTEVQAIVRSERLRRDRRPGLFEFVSDMLDAVST